MPEANEVLECPRIRFKEVPSKLLSTRLGKFLTTFFVFSRSPKFVQFTKFFLNSSPQISDDLF